MVASWQKLLYLSLTLLLSGVLCLLIPWLPTFPLLITVLLGCGFFINSFNTASNSLMVFMLGPDRWRLSDISSSSWDNVQVTALYTESARWGCGWICPK